MKFEDMMTFWKMKGMIHQPSCMTRERIYDSDEKNVVYSIVLRDIPRNGSEHAQIIYRYTEKDGVKSKFALVYADILFTGFRPMPNTDQVYIKNAKVSDLRNHFVERL